MEVIARVENFLTKAFQKFHIIIWSCMKLEDLLKILLMIMPENFLDLFVSFGDVNTAPKRLVKFHWSPIIIQRIWNVCIVFVVSNLMGRRIKHCWLIMDPTRHFGIQNGLRWKSFNVCHIGQKGPSPYYNPFLPYILIPIKNNESKVVKIFRRTIF
jgi:hypothetical protein